MIVFIFKLIY